MEGCEGDGRRECCTMEKFFIIGESELSSGKIGCGVESDTSDFVGSQNYGIHTAFN